MKQPSKPYERIFCLVTEHPSSSQEPTCWYPVIRRLRKEGPTNKELLILAGLDAISQSLDWLLWFLLIGGLALVLILIGYIAAFETLELL